MFFIVKLLIWILGESTMNNYKLIIGLACILGLVGCADMKGRDIGTVAGAVTGAALGSQIGGTGLVNAIGAAGGAVVGGVVGHEVGKKMEKE